MTTATRIAPNAIHPDDLLFFQEVRTAMFRVAKRYELPLTSVEPLANDQVFGRCSSTGHITIAMRALINGEWAPEPVSPKLVWDKAAHELAHLRHLNHGTKFNEFWMELHDALQNEEEDHKEKLLRKLVKLQAQRQSEAQLGNSAAAEAFAAMINKMLVENELSATDIDYARANDNDPVVEFKVDLEHYGIEKFETRCAWQESLARVVAKAHMCSFLLRSGSNQIWFVGTKSHATVAEYAYGILVTAADKMVMTELRRFRRECLATDGHKRRAHGFRNAWLNAFVQRIAQRFDEARAVAVAEAEAREVRQSVPGGTSTAVIRLNGAMTKVQRYMDDKFKKKSANPLATNRRSNAEGTRRGQAAADRMVIGRRAIANTASGPRGLLK
jgi:hypothetical protein